MKNKESVKMEDSHPDYWQVGYERNKAKEPNSKLLFVKGCPYFRVKRDTLRILELVA